MTSLTTFPYPARLYQWQVYYSKIKIIDLKTDTPIYIKNWLIIENSTSSDPLPLSNDNKDQNHRKKLRNKAISIFSIFLIGYPFLTNATILQTTPLKLLFSTGKQETVPDVLLREHNSQTALLLQAATNLDPNPTSKGSDLNIIDNKALVAESGVTGGFLEIENRKNDQISIYQVKPGDSISQIANMFDVSVNTIKWANNLDRAIQPGDELVILPISGIKHTVKSGGTITDIAKKYGADAKEIALFNGLSIDEELKVGQEIIVPNVDLEHEEPKKPSKVTKNKESTTAPAGGSSWMIKPVNGATRSQGLHGNNAIDFAAPIGTPVYAAAGGTVLIAKSDGGWNGGYGNYVVIKHDNGAQTLYAHMTSVLISAGKSISKGVQIGTVGSTGKSTGSHLHFEVRGAKNPF